MFKIYDGRTKFYQWDINRQLIIDDSTITEVHFCNRTGDCSLVCEVYTRDGLRLVNVPNILLQTDWRIFVYAYDTFYTKHEEFFDVVARTRPSDYAYEETEVRTWNALQAQVEAGISDINEAEQQIEQNEQHRQDAEMNRWAAEQDRQEAEKERQKEYNELTADVAKINTKAQNALEAVENTLVRADETLGRANEALAIADDAALHATDACQQATDAAADADSAAKKANTAANNANAAIEATQTAIGAAERAIVQAITAKENAITATEGAEAATARANEAAQGINGKFANALRGNASGSIVTITDISPIEHEMSVKAKSKNIIPFPYDYGGVGAVHTTFDITFVVGENGGIAVTGTASGNAGFYLTTTNIFEHGKTYIFSDSVYVYFIDDNGVSQYLGGKGAKITWNEAYSFRRVYVQINVGKTVNTVLYPIIVEGTTAIDYIPYVNPSTVKINRCGKNLFDDVAFYNENGFKYDDTKRAWLGTHKFIDIFTNTTKVPGRFTIQTEARFTAEDAKALSFAVYYTDGTTDYPFGFTTVMGRYSFTTNKDKVVDKITWSYANNGSYYIRNTMISYTDAASDYEPAIAVEAFPVKADGTVSGVYPIYPATTLMTDKSGVIIECEYNRDLNKAFTELYNAIISMGGNI